MTGKFWTVPRLFDGETVAILASGPSICLEQTARLRGRCRVIAIADSYLLAPWADIHYWCDAKWFRWHRELKANSQAMFGTRRAEALFWGFQGIRVTIENSGHEVHHFDPSVKVLRNDSKRDAKYCREGLCEEPDGIRTGSNSGHQAINLAFHTGPRRILLLGYDMRAIKGRHHWFGDHPERHQQNQQIYPSSFIPALETLKKPLEDHGVEVINCSPGSALTTWPHQSLKDVLARD